MKKFLISLLLFSLYSASANAKTVYVTDQLDFTLRSTASNRSKILKMLHSGTPLTLLGEDPNTGYSYVRTNNGIEGYIPTRYTLPKPISSWYLDKANKQLEELKQENKLFKEELQQIKGNNQEAMSSNQELTQERNTLSNELNELKQTAANAVQLKHQRDQLQEKVISMAKELEQLKRDNQALEDSANQDWFLYGGLLSLFGVILGFILPKLSWRRKTSNWDTF